MEACTCCNAINKCTYINLDSHFYSLIRGGCGADCCLRVGGSTSLKFTTLNSGPVIKNLNTEKSEDKLEFVAR